MASRSNIQLSVSANTAPAETQIRSFIRRMQTNVNGANLNLNLNTRGFTQPLGRITADLNQFQGAMDASIARTLAFGASVGIINGVAKAFSSMAQTAVRVEEALSQINVLLELNQRQLGKFSSDLFDIAKNTAQSFDQVAIAATEFSRQGLTAAETGRRVNDALILTRLSGLDAAKSVESLTAAVNGFKKESITTTEVVNRLANVDAKFAVSSGDLADAVARAGAVSQDAGVSFNQLLAATTAVQQATARGGAVIGNGFKTIFTRLQRSKVLGELEKIGVATKTSTGSIRNAIDILRDYAVVYQTLGDEQKAFTAEQIAGVFQINTLKALVADLTDDFGVYNKSLQVANLSTNEATQRNEKLNETLQSLLSQTGTEFEKLQASVGKIGFEDSFKGLTEVLKGSLETLNAGLDLEGFGGILARGLVAGIGKFLTGPGLVVLGGGLFKLLKFTADQTATAFKQVAAIGSETQKRAAVEEKITRLLQQDDRLLAQIVNSNGNMAAINRAVEESIQRQNRDLRAQQLLVSQIAANIGTKRGADLALPGRGASKGYIPNLVKKEKEAMPTGSKVVAIQDFKTPEGKTTMIANTSETLVRNFQGSGFDAVLTREQSRGMMAAKGFVPNFAKFDFNNFISSKGKRQSPQRAANLVLQQAEAGKTTVGGQEFDDDDIEEAKRIKAGFQAATAAKPEARKKEKEKIQKGLKTFDSVQKRYFMAIPDLGVRREFDEPKGVGVKFKSIEQDLDGVTYEKFKGIMIGINPNVAKNPNSPVKNLSNIGPQLEKAIRQAGNSVFEAASDGLGPDATKSGRKSIEDLLQQGGEGAVEGVKGAFFEAIVTGLTGAVKGRSRTVGKTLDINLRSVGNETPEGRALMEELFNLQGKFLYGDFKANQNQTNSYAKQVIANHRVGRSGAKGYIPNFASKKVLDAVANSSAGKRAMKTERSLAGSARMGFDPRVGFGVFNTSQGSLSGAINEHLASGDPRSSLSTMGADTQKAMSARMGYVPNFISGAGVRRTNFFAQPTSGAVQFSNLQFDDFLPQLSKKDKRRINREAKKKKREEEKEKRGPISKLGLSFGLSTAGGLAAESLGRSDSFGAATTGRAIGGAFQGAAVGTQIGSALGPKGELVGGIVGALAGTVSALESLSDPAAKAQFELQKMVTETSKTKESLKGYEEALKEVKEATTPREQLEASKKLREYGASLTSAQRAALRAGETAEGVSKALEDKLLTKSLQTSITTLGAQRQQGLGAGNNKFTAFFGGLVPGARGVATKEGLERLSASLGGIFQGKSFMDTFNEKRREQEAERADQISSQAQALATEQILSGNFDVSKFNTAINSAGGTAKSQQQIKEQLSQIEGATDLIKDADPASIAAFYEGVREAAIIQKDALKNQAEAAAAAKKLNEEMAEVNKRRRMANLRIEELTEGQAVFMRRDALNQARQSGQFGAKQLEFEKRKREIQSDTSLKETDRITALGEVKAAQRQAASTANEKQRGFSLQRSASQLIADKSLKEVDFGETVTSEERADFIAEINRFSRAIPKQLDKGKSLDAIISSFEKKFEKFSHDKVLADKLANVINAAKVSNIQASEKLSVDLQRIEDETAAAKELFKKNQLKAAEKLFSSFKELGNLPSDIASLFTEFGAGGQTPEQLIQRGRSAAGLDEALKNLGLSEESRARSDLQDPIKATGQLSGLTSIFDSFFGGQRNPNASFRNIDDFASQSGRFAQKILRNEDGSASRSEQAKAKKFLEILQSLKDEGLIFKQTEKQKEEEEIERNVESQGKGKGGVVPPIYDQPIPEMTEGWVQDEIKRLKKQLENLRTIKSNIDSKAYPADDKSDMIDKIELEMYPIKNQLERLYKIILESNDGVTVNVTVTGTGDKTAAEVAGNAVANGVLGGLVGLGGAGSNVLV